ncbi:MAG TPA: hypothetical protein DIU41_10670 [Oscillibacter sp.]|nr:hypothetical protein [Oscillibacter sp.]
MLASSFLYSSYCRADPGHSLVSTYTHRAHQQSRRPCRAVVRIVLSTHDYAILQPNPTCVVLRSRNVNQFLSGPSLCSQTPTLCAIVRNIGAPATRFHDLRHTFAVASIKSGDDVKTVQENLGHATAAFTLDVYGHFTDDMRSVSAQRMEGFITNVLNL